jgi:hypothetical protein
MEDALPVANSIGATSSYCQDGLGPKGMAVAIVGCRRAHVNHHCRKRFLLFQLFLFLLFQLFLEVFVLLRNRLNYVNGSQYDDAGAAGAGICVNR